MDVFIGIDVACAKGKYLPLVICTKENGRLLPLCKETTDYQTLRARRLPYLCKGLNDGVSSLVRIKETGIIKVMFTTNVKNFNQMVNFALSKA